jgi:hypothetical protein
LKRKKKKKRTSKKKAKGNNWDRYKYHHRDETVFGSFVWGGLQPYLHQQADAFSEVSSEANLPWTNEICNPNPGRSTRIFL